MVLQVQTMLRTQNIHRQPRYSTISPPKSGPIDGPITGPSRYHQITPLYKNAQVSSELQGGADSSHLRSLTRVEHITDGSTSISNSNACITTDVNRAPPHTHLPPVKRKAQERIYQLPKRPETVLASRKL